MLKIARRASLSGNVWSQMTREHTGTIKLKSPGGGATNSLNKALFGVGPLTILVSAILSAECLYSRVVVGNHCWLFVSILVICSVV